LLKIDKKDMDVKNDRKPLTEVQIREFAVARLTRLVRGLEKAYILPADMARRLIGDIMKLEAMAKHEFKLK